MHLSLLVPALAALCSFARGNPVAVPTVAAVATADAAEASCPGFPTKTLKFEALPTGSAPPAGFGHLNFKGFTVQNLHDYYNWYEPNELKAASAPNVLVADDYIGASITAGGQQFQVISFRFGCPSYAGHGYEQDDAHCVVSAVTNGAGGTITGQSWQGKSNDTMQIAHVDSGSDTLSLNILVYTGYSYDGLVIDNLVYAAPC